jgi:tryptophan synthase alpha chain
VDGLLVLDLPPEESDNYESLMKQAGLCHIYLVAPTTPEDRMALHRQARQRIYLLHLARRRDRNADERRVESRVAGRQNPRAHGFAHRRRLRHLESQTGQTRRVGADACVVGSAVVNQIAEHGKSPELVAKQWANL